MCPEPCLFAIIDAVFLISINFSSDIYQLRIGLLVYLATFAAELDDKLKNVSPLLNKGAFLLYP